MKAFGQSSVFNWSAVIILLAGFYVSPALANTWKVNFRDADIVDLVRFVADATGKTIVVDPQVKGKIEVVSNKDLDDKELYELFLSILELHGFTAVTVNDVIRIVPLKDVKSMSSSKDADVHAASNTYVTRVIRLRNIDAGKALGLMRPLVSADGYLAAMPENNSLVITDSESNITRLRSLIGQLEESPSDRTEVFPVHYASADDIVKTLSQMQKSLNASATTDVIADKRTNSVIVSGEESERERIRYLVEKLDTPLEQAGNAKVFYLEYAKASDVAAVLSKMGKTLVSKQGAGTSHAEPSVEAYDTANAVIVTADADVMQSFEALIHKLDIRRAQVLIETIIVELQGTDNNNLGIDWLFKTNKGVFGSSVDAATGPLGPISAVTLNPASQPGDYAKVLSGIAGSTFGNGRLSTTGTSFTEIINALKQNNHANILSTPTLLTLDNSQASISVGQQVPFLTGSYTSSAGNPQNPFQTIQRQDVGLSLKVTPHINEGNAVILEINQDVSSLAGTQTSVDVITNQRKLSSTVLAKDDAIIILGGLIKDDVQESVHKVWLLGDIPVLGRLFRSTSSTVVKTNLMVFMHPVIIRDDETLAGATAEKYRYIRDQQRKGSYLGLVPEKDNPELPEWEKQVEALKKLKAQEAAAQGSAPPAATAQAFPTQDVASHAPQAQPAANAQ